MGVYNYISYLQQTYNDNLYDTYLIDERHILYRAYTKYETQVNLSPHYCLNSSQLYMTLIFIKAHSNVYTSNHEAESGKAFNAVHEVFWYDPVGDRTNDLQHRGEDSTSITPEGGRQAYTHVWVHQCVQ